MPAHKLSDALFTYTLEDLIVEVEGTQQMRFTTPFAGGDTVTLQHNYGAVRMPGDEYLTLVAELRIKGRL